MEQRSDDELIDAFLNGDEKAFEHIVERHRSRLTWVARKFAANEMDAHDIVQEAFLRASKNLHTYRREAKLSSWLYRLVYNAGYDYLNHRANRENSSLDSGAIDLDRNPALAFREDTDLRLMLEEALITLREEQREALYLTEVLGYTLAEAAEIQGVQVGTIKSRRARAKEALRQAFE